MALRIYNVELSSSSINQAIKNLRAYQRDLNKRTRLFLDKLADCGIDVIESVIAQIPPDELHDGYILVQDPKKTLKKNQNGGYQMAIKLSGEDVLFIEFSAGVTFGSANYPLPVGNKYGALTYPGQTHASQPYGWFYTDEGTGRTSVHTYGNRAYMPMYHATVAMAMNVWMTAMMTFGV